VGPQDAFITAVERIARRAPAWLLRDDASLVLKLNDLLKRVHGRAVQSFPFTTGARVKARCPLIYLEASASSLSAKLERLLRGMTASGFTETADS